MHFIWVSYQNHPCVQKIFLRILFFTFHNQIDNYNNENSGAVKVINLWQCLELWLLQKYAGTTQNLRLRRTLNSIQLIEKEYNSGRSKTGFQYEHPLLPKLRKYPLSTDSITKHRCAWILSSSFWKVSNLNTHWTFSKSRSIALKIFRGLH